MIASIRSGIESPWVVSMDGALPKQVVNQVDLGHDISPDGRSLAVLSRDEQGRSEIIVCSLPECAGRQRYPAPVGGNPQWAGGGAISYSDGRNVWIQPLDGSPPRQITHFADRVIDDYAWSHNGLLAVSRAIVTNDIVLFKGLNR